MISNFFLSVGAVTAVAFTALCAFCFLRGRCVRPLLGLAERFRRQPWLAKVLLLTLAVRLFVYGSNKAPTNSVPDAGGDVTNAPPAMAFGPRLAAFVSGFAEDEIATGYAVWRVGTNEIPNLARQGFATNADEVAAWRTRGAAEDWARVGPWAFLSDCRILSADLAIDALGLPAGLVPDVNWPLVSGPWRESYGWSGGTAYDADVFVWHDVLLNRDAAHPVSVRAEVSRDGDVLLQYDLSSAGEMATNAVARIVRNGRSVSAPLASNVTSVAFYRLRAADLQDSDRDGDGVPTRAEIADYHSDPGLVDSDGDGVPDDAEVAAGTDPSVRDVPDDRILARVRASSTNEAFRAAGVVVTNSLVAWKLCDGFAADLMAKGRPAFYERTIRIGRTNPWQQFYVSSRPDAAGEWALEGLALEWSASGGESGSVCLSPRGDSFRLPLEQADIGSLTLRLVSTGGSPVRCPTPLYLLAYAAPIEFCGGREIDVADGSAASVYLDGADSEIFVSFDRSDRPHAGPLQPGEDVPDFFAGLEAATRGQARYEGGSSGGRIFVETPGVWSFPAVAVKDSVPVGLLGAPKNVERHLVVLHPSIWYGMDHCSPPESLAYDWQDRLYVREYRYPLNSKCIWRAWHLSVEGAVTCSCTPGVSSGLEPSAGPRGLVTTDYDFDDASVIGTVFVAGVPVWGEEAKHNTRERCTYHNRGRVLLTELDACETCADTCTDGVCVYEEGPAMDSLDFRIPVGLPRKGQISGFAYFRSEGPLTVTPAVFDYLFRDDADATVVTNGTARRVVCRDRRGFDILIEPVPDGVRATVREQATQALEHTWLIVNEGGPSAVRFRKISRLDNVMEDKTFAVDAWGGWSMTDNVSGVTETLERSDGLNDPDDGLYQEWRGAYDADGETVSYAHAVSERIGECDAAVLRQTFCEEWTPAGWIERRADYWDDQEHRARHGNLRLLVGDDVGWEYHDWDKDGRETLLVEQRNGSAAPAEFPTFASNRLAGVSGLADAFVTTYDYTPRTGDANSSDEFGEPRCETRYVVRGGVATVVARTWRRYAHVTCGPYAAVREETVRAAGAGAAFDDPANARSETTVLSETAPGVPLVLRGETVGELDEDGTRTTCSVSATGGVVSVTARKSFGGLPLPTYEVVERDDAYGNVLRRATYLTDGDVLVDEEVSLYDDRNRLRSTRFPDGTSLTNAYSCCRLLWSSDREGRKTLRSAVTGEDLLYHADEEVWLRDVATNGGHKVTQRFSDGFGREVATAVYVASVPGEATNSAASAGRVLSATTVSYPRGHGSLAVSVDARGKKTVRERLEFADRSESVESVYADGTAAEPVLTTRRIRYRGGASVTEKAWDGKWTRETELSDYGADGREVRREVTESSDCGTVTNRVAQLDFLGRTVRETTPRGTTETSYRGATERIDVTTVTAGDVVRTASAVYDEWGERVGETQDGVTRRTDERYETDACGAVWKVTRSTVADGTETESSSESREQLTGRAAGVVSRRIDVDADGAVDETVVRFGAEAGERVTTVSNAAFGVTTSVARHGLTTEVATDGWSERLDYDPLARQVARTRGPVRETSVRDAVGAVVARRTYTNATDFVTETFAYDSFGRCVAATNALGEGTWTRYDAVGNVIGRGGATWPARFEYDTAGRRVSLSTTRNGTIWDVTRWTYDPATGECLAKRYPDGSQVGHSLTPDGLPLQTTKASGAWSRNAYDEKRQLVGTVSSDGALDAAFAYDAFGKMTSASNAVAQYAYARHCGGIVTNETARRTGGSPRTLTRTVDGFGRISARGVSGQDLQAVAYDGKGRIAAVSDGAAAVAYAYGEDGADMGYALALTGGATIERRVVRDIHRPELVLAVSNFVNGVAVDGERYTRDAKGRIVERVENVERVERVGYDSIGQVVEVANYQQPTTNYQLRSYSYDLIGNIADSAALAYTVDGEMTGVGGLSFGYDSASRLTTVSTGGVTIAAYAYDAFGRRVRKTTPAAVTTYLYDGWNLVREEIAGTNGTADVVEYCWGKDTSGSLDTAGGVGGLLYLKRNGTVYVPLYDANGNVTAYVDASGAIVISFDYDAFGNTTVHLHLSPSPYIPAFRYSTKYFDAETGLYYYGYRHYSPTTARWLTRDPLEEQGGLNLHCFCENDGVNRYDALGMVADGEIVAGARNMWRLFAKYYFRMYKGWPISAMFLELSVDGIKRSRPIVYSEGSMVSSAIKRSEEYQRKIDGLIQMAVVGFNPFHNTKDSITFMSGDLYAAVKQAEIRYDGRICKARSGRTKVDLDITVSDKYNFEWWGLNETQLLRRDNGLSLQDVLAMVNATICMIGNNMAYIDQQAGAIQPFKWKAVFEEKR